MYISLIRVEGNKMIYSPPDKNRQVERTANTMIPLVLLFGEQNILSEEALLYCTCIFIFNKNKWKRNTVFLILHYTYCSHMYHDVHGPWNYLHMCRSGGWVPGTTCTCVGLVVGSLELPVHV